MSSSANGTAGPVPSLSEGGDLTVAASGDDDYSLDVSESDLADEVAPDSTVTWSTDWTVSTVIDQLARDRFDLEPAFQRRDVWNDIKRSRFIESLLLGIPVPQVILAERRHARGKFIVLDGKQRLRSLQRFAGLQGTPMRLTGLEVLKQLNGKTYERIRSDPDLETYAAALDNQAIRAVVLRDWRSESLLYLTFLRLNFNVVGLSPQELRRALHPGPFMEYVMQTSSESAGIRRFLSITAPDFRMRDAEILTRHIGLTMRLTSYRGDLRKFLDETCEVFNASWEDRSSEISSCTQGLDQAIQATFVIFGRDAFKRPTAQGYESRRNRAVLDVMTYYLQHEEVRGPALDSATQFKTVFEQTCRDKTELTDYLTSTTKSVGAVFGRLRIWGDALRENIHSVQPYVP